jgi:hypothetical protein
MLTGGGECFGRSKRKIDWPDNLIFEGNSLDYTAHRMGSLGGFHGDTSNQYWNSR